MYEINLTYKPKYCFSIIYICYTLVIKSDLISQAKGSAYIELGATKVIVAVYDPREIPKQNNYS